MKYVFPITVEVRNFLPAVNKLLEEVETTVSTMTNERLRLSYRATVFQLSVESPQPLTNEQINVLTVETAKQVEAQFPGADVEVGRPMLAALTDS